jgi:hypothetical protein
VFPGESTSRSRLAMTLWCLHFRIDSREAHYVGFPIDFTGKIDTGEALRASGSRPVP